MRFIVLLICLSSAFAAGPNLDLLTQDQANAVSKEFSANFVHTTVAPASSLGDVWGFEVGLIGGLTKTPEIDRLSKTFDAGSDIDKIPHAALMGQVTVPFGLTAEINIIPEIDASDVSLQHTSLGVKWTFNSYLDKLINKMLGERPEPFKLPIDMALRLHGSANKLTYDDVINNSSTGNVDVNGKVSYETSSIGFNVTLSKKILFFEPYVGLGYVSNDTEIEVSGASNISIFTFSSSSTYDTDNSGSHLFAGANVNLFFLKLGIEYSKLMSISRVSGKLSFYF